MNSDYHQLEKGQVDLRQNKNTITLLLPTTKKSDFISHKHSFSFLSSPYVFQQVVRRNHTFSGSLAIFLFIETCDNVKKILQVD